MRACFALWRTRIEFMSAVEFQVLHLRVAAEPDPGVLARLLERFQNLNVLPRRVVADWATTGPLHIEVHVLGLSGEHAESHCDEIEPGAHNLERLLASEGA